MSDYKTVELPDCCITCKHSFLSDLIELDCWQRQGAYYSDRADINGWCSNFDRRKSKDDEVD